MLCHAVGQLMGNNIVRQRIPMHVSIYYLRSIPEGVCVRPAVMDRRDDLHSIVVQAVPAVLVGIQVISSYRIFVCRLRMRITCRTVRVGLITNERTGERSPVSG